MILIKILLIGALTLILYQDIKERQVYWFLFPLIGLIAGFLFYKEAVKAFFYTSIAMNFVLVSTLILVVVLYSKLKLKAQVTRTIGLGDLLMLVFLSFTFSTVSFMVILIGSLIFSLTLHLVLKKYSNHKTVPLAGYMGLFFSLSYIAFWSGIIDSLYNI